MEWQSHEIRVLLTNGKVVNFTYRELQTLLRDGKLLTLLLIALVMLAASNPTFFPTLPVYSSRIFYWGVCIILYLLLLPVWVRTVYVMYERIFPRGVPLLLSTAPLVFALTWFGASLPDLLGEWLPERGDAITWLTYIKNWMIAHVMETVGLLRVLPAVRSRQADEDPEGFVVLGGRSMPLETLKSVQSAGHYLIVSTSIGRFESRTRMSDFLNQVGEDAGIQTHRSHWVARGEVLGVSGTVVKTRSGTDIPIARGRLSTVRAWCRIHNLPH
jgi:hypothetical protein